MASNTQAFSRSMTLYVEQNLSSEALRKNLARQAVDIRENLIATGEAPPHWRRYVDGQPDVLETAVRLDGKILYAFNIMAEAAKAALAACREASPVRSGRFRDAWMVAYDGKPWKQPLKDLPDDAEVLIVNPMPYARAIEAGSLEPRVARKLVEKARQQIIRLFPTLWIDRIFASIPPGFVSYAPYILRGASGERRTAKGALMTYPALSLKVRR